MVGENLPTGAKRTLNRPGDGHDVAQTTVSLSQPNATVIVRNICRMCDAEVPLKTPRALEREQCVLCPEWLEL